VNAQTENAQSTYSLSIPKDATSGLIVTDGATYVNGFDITYTIKGTQFDYDKTRYLAVSAIANDFINSPTMDYQANLF
jgi:hypothetical protein